MLSDEALQEIEDHVYILIVSQQKEHRRMLAAAKARVHELELEINRLVDAIAHIGFSEALKERLRSAETERTMLVAKQYLKKPTSISVQKTEIMQRIRVKLTSSPP